MRRIVARIPPTSGFSVSIEAMAHPPTTELLSFTVRGERVDACQDTVPQWSQRRVSGLVTVIRGVSGG
jgi:hypothetical protein